MQELWYKAQKAGEAADEVGDEGYVKLGAPYACTSAWCLAYQCLFKMLNVSCPPGTDM